MEPVQIIVPHTKAAIIAAFCSIRTKSTSKH
jgi:hypothetical protein